MALLQRAVRRRFGATAAAAFVLLTALQFHLPFYLSRTLPNVLAMLLTNAGLAAWLEGGSPLPPIYLLAAAAVRRLWGGVSAEPCRGCCELACYDPCIVQQLRGLLPSHSFQTSSHA